MKYETNKITGNPKVPDGPKRDGGGVMHPVERIIWASPPWASLGRNDGTGRRRIRQALDRLRAFSLDEIREGLEAYIDTAADSPSGHGLPEMSRIFLVNRFTLDIPPIMPRESARFFGGWVIPEAEQGANILWPFSGAGRSIRLVGRFDAYAGAPYDGLSEFDSYRGIFGSRWIAS